MKYLIILIKQGKVLQTFNHSALEYIISGWRIVNIIDLKS